MTAISPARSDDVVAAVREHARLIPHGSLSKAPLVAHDPGAVSLDMTALSGISEYNPGEYTFTARAGTPLREIAQLLARNGQHMPFDPPLADHGATIGGTVASGMNGPGRLRYGGLRDFVIGVRLVDGTGRLVTGGGRVVKNAAGFDLPKLMVGSMGRLGIITELTFKVFPSPEAWRTVCVSCGSFENALTLIAALARQPLELEALELEPPATLMIRVAGAASAVDAHARRVGEIAGYAYELIAGEEESDYWRKERAFAWVEPGHRLIKVPLTLRRLAQLERTIQQHELPRRYGVAGNVAWLAWPIERSLTELDLGGLAGLVVRGAPLDGASPWLGAPPQSAEPFAGRVKDALDPCQRLPALV